MSFNKKLTPALFAVAIVCILAGVILFALLVPGAASAFFRVCFIIMAVTLLLIGVAIFYLLYNSRDTEPNFFLYDTKAGRNIDPEELDFTRVNNRMAYFMGTLTSSQERLWSDNVLTVNPARFGVKEIYRPLAAYKMLYDLAAIDNDDAWSLFICASESTIDALLAALRVAGESDMPLKLERAYKEARSRDDIAWLRDYLLNNMNYLEGKMLVYVKKNLEWFY